MKQKQKVNTLFLQWNHLYNNFSAVNALIYYSENLAGKKSVIQLYLYNFSVDEEGNYCITEIDRRRAANTMDLFFNPSLIRRITKLIFLL
jgi:hypothetical protein